MHSQWSSGPDYIEPNNCNFANGARAFNRTNFTVFKDGTVNSIRGWDVSGNTIPGFYQQDLHIRLVMALNRPVFWCENPMV